MQQKSRMFANTGYFFLYVQLISMWYCVLTFIASTEGTVSASIASGTIQQVNYWYYNQRVRPRWNLPAHVRRIHCRCPKFTLRRLWWPRRLRHGSAGRSLEGIAGSNTAGGIKVCLLWVLCVVRYGSLRRADPSSRGVLLSVVCLNVITKPQQWGSLGPLGILRHENEIRFLDYFLVVYVPLCSLEGGYESTALKRKIVGSSKSFVPLYQTAQHHSPRSKQSLIDIRGAFKF